MRRARHGRTGLRKQQRDDGWEQFGGYMNAKKAKLDKQFNNSSTTGKSPAAPTSTTPTDEEPQIFRGVSVYINGYTNPPEPELRAIFTKFGGVYTSYLLANTTYVIASNLPMGKKKLLAAKTLRADWIVDSAKAGKKLDPRNYMLYNLNAENKQATLSQHFVKPKYRTTVPPANAEPATSGDCDELKNIQISQEVFPATQNVEEVKKNEIGGQGHVIQTVMLSPLNPRSKDPSYEKVTTAAAATVEEVTVVPATEDFIIPDSECEDRSEEDSPHAEANKSTNTVGGSGAGNKLKTAGEDGFLEDFYNNSRLHLISTMKKEMQLMVSEWRTNSATHKFPFAEAYEDSLLVIYTQQPMEDLNGQVLFHVDLDCFFVAVGRLSRPHLSNKPVAVTHSKGSGKSDSRSDVSCASYEARAKGVKAGMWLHQAKELCPEIVAIPYEFEEYKRVSKIFYETVGGLTLEMEPISIDEMVLDVTEIIRRTSSNPTTLAAFLRKAIMDEAKISASIGIGSNKLSAKLATRVAKDRKLGHYYMQDSEMRDYIRSQPVKSLPGVGWATAERLATLNVQTGSQLEALSLDDLKKTFGERTGEKLHSICRGIDMDTVNCESVNAKSLSAGCSWGVRFTKHQELEKFIRNLASEISQRASKSKCYGSKLSLQLWVVRKGYENVTIKPGGHGVVDISTRTRKFLQHTRETSIIASTALELARSIMKTTIPADHVRGVSISMDGLKYETDMTEKEKKTVQTTLFAPARRQSSRLSGRNSSLNLESSTNANTLFEEKDAGILKTETSVTKKIEKKSPPENETKKQEANSKSPEVEVIEEMDEVETDMFTGAVLPPTPVKDDEKYPGQDQSHITPPKPQPPKENTESENNSGSDVEMLSEEMISEVNSRNHEPSTSTVVDTKSNKTENGNFRFKPELKKQNKTKPKSKPKSNPILLMYNRKPNLNLDIVPGSILSEGLDVSLSDYDPAVQQRIMDSFKKTVKLPHMNGVSDIHKVQNIINEGTKGRMPTSKDKKSLDTYFKELTSGPLPFLKQSCEMMTFLKKLQLRLESEKENESQAWAKIFEKITTEMNTAIVARFGGSFNMLTE